MDYFTVQNWKTMILGDFKLIASINDYEYHRETGLIRKEYKVGEAATAILADILDLSFDLAKECEHQRYHDCCGTQWIPLKEYKHPPGIESPLKLSNFDTQFGKASLHPFVFTDPE